MKLWCTKIKLFPVRIEPMSSVGANRHPIFYTIKLNTISCF